MWNTRKIKLVVLLLALRKYQSPLQQGFYKRSSMVANSKQCGKVLGVMEIALPETSEIYLVEKILFPLCGILHRPLLPTFRTQGHFYKLLVFVLFACPVKKNRQKSQVFLIFFFRVLDSSQICATLNSLQRNGQPLFPHTSNVNHREHNSW